MIDTVSPLVFLAAVLTIISIILVGMNWPNNYQGDL